MVVHAYFVDSLKAYSLAIALLTSLPILLILFYGFGWMKPQTVNIMIRSVELTLFASGVAILIDVVLLTPLSFYLSRSRNSLVETLVDLPASVPHPVVGIGVLLTFSQYFPPGQFLSSHGLQVFDEITGLVIALILVSAPVYVRSCEEAFSSVPKDVIEAFSTMGFGKWGQLAYVALPYASRSILNSALTAMARAISEFGSVAIVAYYVLNPPFTGVKYGSVLVYEIFNYQGLQAAVAASAILVAIGGLMSLAARLLTLLSRRGGK